MVVITAVESSSGCAPTWRRSFRLFVPAGTATSSPRRGRLRRGLHGRCLRQSEFQRPPPSDLREPRPGPSLPALPGAPGWDTRGEGNRCRRDSPVRRVPVLRRRLPRRPRFRSLPRPRPRNRRRRRNRRAHPERFLSPVHRLRRPLTPSPLQPPSPPLISLFPPVPSFPSVPPEREGAYPPGFDPGAGLDRYAGLCLSRRLSAHPSAWMFFAGPAAFSLLPAQASSPPLSLRGRPGGEVFEVLSVRTEWDRDWDRGRARPFSPSLLPRSASGDALPTEREPKWNVRRGNPRSKGRGRPPRLLRMIRATEGRVPRQAPDALPVLPEYRYRLFSGPCRAAGKRRRAAPPTQGCPPPASRRHAFRLAVRTGASPARRRNRHQASAHLPRRLPPPAACRQPPAGGGSYQ